MVKRRKQLRLKEFDYSQSAAYFITVCSEGREHLFGKIVEENRFSEIVRACWNKLPAHYPTIELDSFVVMPNHVHGIIKIFNNDRVGAGLRPCPYRGKTISFI